MGMANGERKKGKGSMKKCPLLLMSDFYHIAGRAEDLLELYAEDTEMKKLLLAQILYFRGEVEKASSSLRDIHADALDFDARVGLEMMRALCALHQGDIAAWQDVKQQMKAMLDHCADQREQLLFWTASIDSMIDDATAFPQWFKKGELNILPSFLMAFFRSARKHQQSQDHDHRCRWRALSGHRRSENFLQQRNTAQGGF